MVLGSVHTACSDLIKEAQDQENNGAQNSGQDPSRDIQQTLETEKKQVKMSLIQQLTFGKWQNCNKLVTGGYVLTEVGYRIDGKRPIRQKIYKDEACSVEFTSEEIAALSPSEEMRDLYAQGVAKMESFKLGKISGNVADIDFPQESGTSYTRIKLDGNRLIVAACDQKTDMCGTSADNRASNFENGYVFNFVKN
jgi:hypothetical protein